MKRIVTAALLIPLVLLLVLGAPYWLQVLAAACVGELALHEYLVLADTSGTQSPRVLVLVCGAALFAVVYWMPGLLLPALGACGLLLLGVCTLRSPLFRVLADTSYSFFGLFYVIYPLTLMLLLLSQENGAALLLFLMVVVWAGDITALYVGRAWGQRKMVPVLSPKKTWEGAAGSLGGSIFSGLCVMGLGNLLFQHGYILLLYPHPWWYWVLLAAILNIAAQIGDLLESALKRGADVKDSGALLPGHGGMLDRVDALLVALPVLWYVLLLQQTYLF